MRTVDGATVLVTGASDGLGYELARSLVTAGARVLVHGRDTGRVETATAALGTDAPRAPVGYVADFAELTEVRSLADAIAADYGELDVLVNNAGLGAGPPGQGRQISPHGYELQFQVNYLATFLLTRLLLPQLRKSGAGRVIHVASGAQQAIDFDNVMLDTGYEGWRAYSQSKLAMVADAFTLATELDAAEVTVNSLHPASLMDTKMVRETFGSGSAPVSEGVDAVLRLITDPDLDGVTGAYFDGRAEARAAAQAYDPVARAELARLAGELIERAETNR